MEDFRQKRGNKQDYFRVLRGIAGVLLLLLVTFFAARGAWGMYGKFAAASRADAAAQKELKDLEMQHQKVSAAVASLSSDRGVEAGVRERYGVALPGEGQIDIVRREATSTAESLDQGNMFQKIFRALFVW